MCEEVYQRENPTNVQYYLLTLKQDICCRATLLHIQQIWCVLLADESIFQNEYPIRGWFYSPPAIKKFPLQENVKLETPKESASSLIFFVQPGSIQLLALRPW